MTLDQAISALHNAKNKPTAQQIANIVIDKEVIKEISFNFLTGDNPVTNDDIKTLLAHIDILTHAIKTGGRTLKAMKIKLT